MATNKSKGNVKGAAKGKPAAKKPAAAPKVKTVKAVPFASVVKGGVDAYTGLPIKREGAGAVSPAMPRGIGTFGKDCWGNTGGTVPFNRALIALSFALKSGEVLKLSDVQPISEALGEAGGLAPVGSGIPGGQCRSQSANGSHVNTLRTRHLLCSDDAAEMAKIGEKPAARGTLVLTKRAIEYAQAFGTWNGLTAEEKKAVAAYNRRIAGK